MTVSTDPIAVRLARGILQHDHWSVPQAIITEVFQPSARVAVKACHASSKTFTAADCVLIALLMGGDVLTTASTWDQVKNVLWDQIHRAISDGVIPAKEWGQINETEITLPTGEHAMGLSTNEYTRFQGYHARPDSFLLVVVDEATGVRPDIYQAIEGISAGGDVRILLLGNPTEPSGYFYDVFASESPIWRRYTIDAFDTPNLAGVSLDDLLKLSDSDLDTNERSYLVTRRWVHDRFFEWGVDHPEWQSRVRGEFPQNADISLIWRSWIDTANREAHYVADAGALTAGVDVAGPGEDETVCYVRQGAHVLDAYSSTQREIYGPVLTFLRPYLHRGLSQVNVDSVGIGEGMYIFLRDHLDGVQVNDVNVARVCETQDAKEAYVNQKAEMYWALRERFRNGEIDGITDARLIAQLTAIRYKHKLGRIEIESKDDMAKRRGQSADWKSPDRAEALALAFAPTSRDQRLVQMFRRAAVKR